METKEAILFLNSKKYRGDEYTNNNKFVDDVIELLQQGEKYRQMWEEELKIIQKPYYIYTNDKGKEFHYHSHGNTKELMDKLEQKYLKEAKQDYSEGKE